MKGYIKKLMWALALCTSVSCGKYGYDFADGYQNGDKGSSPISTDTTMNVADKSYYNRARIFPGLVGEEVRRIVDTTISFDMNFQSVSASDLKVYKVPLPIFSTGLYAPAGENIRITVPAGILGLSVQVGAHADNLTGQDPLRRDAQIFTKQALFPGVNYVKNLYGGTIWINTNIARQSPLNLKFSGAVHAPDFVLGQSNVQQWLAEVEATDVPWLEARSKHVIYTIPRSFVITYKAEASRIASALQEWNEIYEQDFYTWMGLTENNADRNHRYPDLPERAVLDIQPREGYAHSGMPWVALMDKHWFSVFVDDSYFLSTNTAGGLAWGAFHELGHNYQQNNTWSWNGMEETTNNLFIWKFAQRKGRMEMAIGENIPAAFTVGLNYAARSGSKNIITDTEMTSGNHALSKILLFLQIYNKALGRNGESGWDFMPFIYKNARNVNYVFSLDEAKRDFFYRNLCDFTGQDWQRFCAAWGIRVSSLAKNEMAAKYSPMTTSVWTYNPLTNTGGEGVLSPKVDLDNTEWTIIQKSTEEVSGEGANNGRAIFMIDGKSNTFWHSQWQNGTATLPMSITFQLKDNEIVKGFYLIPRQNNSGQRPRSIEIQISKDNVNYKKLVNADLENGYTFSMLNSAARKEFRLKTKEEIRYIRIFFRENNLSNSIHHAVAEFGAFYDVD